MNIEKETVSVALSVSVAVSTHKVFVCGRHVCEHYSAIKNKEFLPFATTCVNLEGIMLK